MLQRPRFKPHLHVEIVKDEGVFVLSEPWQTVLQGRLFEVVAPWLDGRPLEAVCERLAGQASPAEVFYTVKTLDKRGYLCEGNGAPPSDKDSFWALLGIDPPTLARRLAETVIEVHALGLDDIEALRSLLQSTLDRYGYHVSPICGAVTALERSGHADGIMHVYLSGSNSARSPRSLAHVKSDLRSSAGGKGSNDLQARASALCEGLERSCGVFRGDEPRRRARLADLGDAAIPPTACMLFSEKQYQEREAWNARRSRYSYVPVAFDPKQEIEWSPVWLLTHQTVRYVPAAFCYYDYPFSPETDFCVACSNGCAAGNCLEEAILLSSFPCLSTDDLKKDILVDQSRVEELGLEMLVLDQTRPEIGMPVVKVIVPGLRHFWPRFAPGRLYDVPVKLGWLPQPLTEEQLNLVPMFL